MKSLLSTKLSLTLLMVLMFKGAFGQFLDPVFSFDTVAGSPGDTVSLELKAERFIDIKSFQFSLNFDTTQLEFISINCPCAFQNISFNSNMSSQGILTVGWFDINATSETLADNTVLFNLRFKIRNTAGGFSSIDFSNSPTNIEIIDKDFNQLNDYELKPGGVNAFRKSKISGNIFAPNGKAVSFQSMYADFKSFFIDSFFLVDWSRLLDGDSLITLHTGPAPYIHPSSGGGWELIEGAPIRIGDISIDTSVTDPPDIIDVYPCYCECKKDKPSVMHGHTGGDGWIGVWQCFVDGAPAGKGACPKHGNSCDPSGSGSVVDNIGSYAFYPDAPVGAPVDSFGGYELDFLEGSDIVVMPTRYNDSIPTNGITSADIAIIRQHILAVSSISNPYALIAADVNKDGEISFLDINFIQSLIISGGTNLLPLGGWTFIPENYIFPDPLNPFDYPHFTLLDSIFGTIGQVNFFGVKLGDVNSSFDPTVAKVSNSDFVSLFINEHQVSEESTIEVPVIVSDFNGIAAFQFNVEWDSTVLEYENMVYTQNNIQPLAGTHFTSEGRLIVLWDDLMGLSQSLDDNDTLFMMKFSVIGNHGDSTYIRFTENIATPIEFVNQDIEPLIPVLQDGKVIVSIESNVIELLNQINSIKAYPNPFDNYIYVEMDVFKEINLTAMIYDFSGKVIETKKLSTRPGLNKIKLGESLPTGIYFIIFWDEYQNQYLFNSKVVKF
ncbi:MAG: T9SS C-terminal target domain-containing protein [Chitinophagaceae bacterium]|nr:MAG: T9SS C-terminal target domain-containing protein [Chitinophagaceae bacterium]